MLNIVKVSDLKINCTEIMKLIIMTVIYLKEIYTKVQSLVPLIEDCRNFKGFKVVGSDAML